MSMTDFSETFEVPCLGEDPTATNGVMAATPRHPSELRVLPLCARGDDWRGFYERRSGLPCGWGEEEGTLGDLF